MLASHLATPLERVLKPSRAMSEVRRAKPKPASRTAHTYVRARLRAHVCVFVCVRGAA